MNFLAKAVWVYENEVIDKDVIDKLHKYNIKTVYIDPRSDNHVAEIGNLRTAGFLVGAYFADSWHPEMTPQAWASWVSQVLNATLPRVGAEAPPCMLDLEDHDIERKRKTITYYKSHQPLRPTSFTNAPFQAPIEPWDVLRKYAMPYYVQVYNGDMSLVDASRAILEVCRYHSNALLVHPFYAGEHVGTDQVEGCYFTLERMP